MPACVSVIDHRKSFPSLLGEGDRPPFGWPSGQPLRVNCPTGGGWWSGLLAPLSFLLSACVPATQAEAPHPHPTIVSLNPCSDAILAEVADPAQILAISHYSADPRSTSMDPAQASRFRTTRGTAESVLALHPDLVIEGSFIAPATAGAYQRLGLHLETLPIANTVEESRAQIRQLAALAGHPERGEALIRRIEKAVAQAAPPPGVKPISAIVWESGGMVPGDNTLIADLLRRTGFTNASAAQGFHQADLLPLERMLANPPAVILTTAADGPQASEDRLLRHPALASLRATTRAPLAPNLLYCAGPTIIRAVDRLAEVRHQIRPVLPKAKRGGGPPAQRVVEGYAVKPTPSRKREGSQTALSSPLPLAPGVRDGQPQAPRSTL